MRKKNKKIFLLTTLVISLICVSLHVGYATNEKQINFNSATINNDRAEYTNGGVTSAIELVEKVGDDYQKINITADNITVDFDNNIYLHIVNFDNVNLLINGSNITIPNDGYVLLTADMVTGPIALESKISQGGDGPQQVFYPVKAYFDGIDNPVDMDSDGNILIPDGFTTGNVTFKAQVYKLDSTKSETDPTNIIPNDGSRTDLTTAEVLLSVEGINNLDSIKNTVVSGESVGENKPTYVVVKSGFSNYGKASLHLVGVGDMCELPQLVTKSLINVEASASINMTYNYGSSNVNQALITSGSTEGNLSVFFGNTSAVLKVTGANVERVESVTKIFGIDSTSIDIKDVAINFSDLSVATDARIKLNIKLTDGKIVERYVNVKRTAITLSANAHNNKVVAGYVVNKAYLYNNLNHNPSIFDAYLQVTLYKDDTVVGFKQVQIDDEDLVNNLADNHSFALETFDQNPIVVYNNEIAGVNKVSVFLTNGKINVDSNLPSIKYGIGSGVVASWVEE